MIDISALIVAVIFYAILMLTSYKFANTGHPFFAFLCFVVAFAVKVGVVIK